jgi:hypothetical protein
MVPGQPLENYQDEIYLAGLAGFASLADPGPEVLARRPLPGNGLLGQPGIGRSSGPETGNPGAWRPAAT